MIAGTSFEPSSDDFSADDEGVILLNPAIAALISGGHTVLFTYGGTWMSKVRHISIIC